MRGTLHHGLLGGDSGAPEYLAMTSMGSDGFRVSFSLNTLEYRIGNGQWNTLEIGSQTPLVGLYETIYFRKTNPTISSADGMGRFVITGPVMLSGNCMSLLYGDSASSYTSITTSSVFRYLFKGNENTIMVAEGFLPAKTLSWGCYYGMFEDCIGLLNAPELPATTLDDYCYTAMFSGCTSLTSTPALPVTTLKDGCYEYLFRGCTSLTSAPVLPATTLAPQCYYGMFDDCTSLTSAPALPATTLAQQCYHYLFNGCTSLTSAPALPATTLVKQCYYCMFRGCTGLTSAPALLAPTLVESCYSNMFENCTSLSYIKMLATDIGSQANFLADPLYGWVRNVPSGGTFVKHPNTTLQIGSYSYNGIPSGWTVQTATS